MEDGKFSKMQLPIDIFSTVWKNVRNNFYEKETLIEMFGIISAHLSEVRLGLLKGIVYSDILKIFLFLITKSMFLETEFPEKQTFSK